MPDLVMAQDALESIANHLNGLKVKWYIDSGTLLAAYRDKSFNQYDHDIDVRIMPGEITDEMMPDLVKWLWEQGYHVIASNWGRRAELICVTMDKLMLDLKFSFEDKNLHWKYAWAQAFSPEKPMVHVYPKKFFENLGTVDLRGYQYPCPTPVLEYIEYHYGPEWKLFKVRAEDAKETDLTWDFMKSPPHIMTVEQLVEKRKELNALAPKTEGAKEK